MKSNYKRLGDYIHQVDVRNTDKKCDKLRGLSMTKEFRDSTSNIVGTDMSVYKVMKKWQFACDFMSVIRVNKLPVVLKIDDEPNLVSPAYSVFEVDDVQILNPEYLMMWFRREEFDRYAFFKCDSAIRGGFDWDELCDTTLPVPSINKQNEIVAEYKVMIDRINLNNQLVQKLEETAQSIYKQWFVDFDFPDDSGQPYKSSGGEMEFNKDLEKEIPKGWEADSIKRLTSTIDNRGKTPPHLKERNQYPLIEIGAIHSANRMIDYDKCEKYLDEEIYQKWFRSGHPLKKDVLFSTVGSLAELKVFWQIGGAIAQNLVAFRCKENIGLYFYQVLINSKNDLISYEIGSVQASLKVSHIVEHKLLKPDKEISAKFEAIAEVLTEQIFVKSQQNTVLNKTLQVLLQRMTGI